MHGTDRDERTTDVAVAVVEAVAEVRGVDPRTMEPTLHSVVDPDTLERLVESEGFERATFTYGECTVLIDGDGSVTVDDPSVTIESDDTPAVDPATRGSG